ncbi:hypothetical protein [Cereibacter sphaeroides]|uniref:hypothetical protein n=1 Tax=Cereibacter sphaeroides TaxID=1063 RepID=UPI003F6964BA
MPPVVPCHCTHCRSGPATSMRRPRSPWPISGWSATRACAGSAPRTQQVAASAPSAARAFSRRRRGPSPPSPLTPRRTC